MARIGATFSMGGIARHAKRLSSAPARIDRIAKRATATLVRRLKPETARIIAADVLNLAPSRVSQHLQVEQTKAGADTYVTVFASRTRLPLSDYKPSFSRDSGVTVTTWRDAGPQRLQHAFRRTGQKGVWQRVPKNKGSAGLVARLPIVQRKGPSMHRVFLNRGPHAGHVDISGRLSTFTEQVLSLEIARLIRADQ